MENDTKFVEINGQQVEVRQLANGSLMDVVTGKFISGATISDPRRGGLITSENAAWMQAKRGAAATEKAREAVLLAVREKELPANTGEEAWGHIMLELAKFALEGELLGKSKKSWTRERLEAVKLLGRATRFLTTEKADELSALRAKEMNFSQTNNYFADDPEFIAAFLDARCPVCNEIRRYGVEHVCANEEKAIEGEIKEVEGKITRRLQQGDVQASEASG